VSSYPLAKAAASSLSTTRNNERDGILELWVICNSPKYKISHKYIEVTEIKEGSSNKGVLFGHDSANRDHNMEALEHDKVNKWNTRHVYGKNSAVFSKYSTVKCNNSFTFIL